MGVVFGVIFLIWCFRSGDGWATAGVILYLFGMLMSYLASTIYHAVKARSVWKERLRKWDHAAIYWHIAGSYSPITLIALREQGYWGWSLFSFIWIIALVILVITMVVRFYRRDKAAGLLQLPYLTWTVFASYLNLMAYLLNR